MSKERNKGKKEKEKDNRRKGDCRRY